MNFGDKIKSRRESMKLSQEYVAEQLGVSRQAVSKWETGRSEPTAGNLVRLAEVFEISLSELIEPDNGDESMISEQRQSEKKPNPVLRTNLMKWAIILQAVFLQCSTVSIRAYLNESNGQIYIGLVAFDLIMLAVCSIWMASNHRFETDMKRRLRNVSIELGYCMLQMIGAILDIYLGLGFAETVVILFLGLFYILYVNPKFMFRKLTK